MKIKLFGIGNILLCDDAIGVRVLERLLPEIHHLFPEVEALIGETNYLYCLDYIHQDDFIIILDSTYLRLEPGTVSCFSFNECDNFITGSQAAHEMTLLKALKLEYPKIQGCLIGIEIARIDFSLELSEKLQSKLENICLEVIQLLHQLTKVHIKDSNH